MAFPSTIAVFTNPNATDRLNSPSHSSIHSAVNNEVIQIENFIGTLPTSLMGSLVYDIRSPDSNGGGHVQTANKGGTGQTNYNKGDLLVAQSSSVLTRLAVSSSMGQVLTVDPTQVVGFKWANIPTTTKVVAQLTGVSLSGPVSTGVLFATSILGSTLGTSNAIRYTATLDNFSKAISTTFTLTAQYGGNTIATFVIPSNPSVIGTAGYIEGYIVASIVSGQKATAWFNTAAPGVNAINPVFSYSNGISSVNSSADQNFVITGTYSNNDNVNSVLGGIFIVEKIV